MKFDVKSVFVLELDELEATWLNAVMQNPLHAQHPSEETKFDKEMREKFFFATKEQKQ